MNQRQLYCFLTVLRHGSVRLAAEELGISPQGVSKTIRSLEQEVGAPLFVRTGSGVVPSRRGRDLQPYAQRVLGAFEELERHLHRDASGRQILTVPCTYDVLCLLPAEFVADFADAHPQVLLSLVEMNDFTAMEKLAQGEAELALLPSPLDVTRFSGEALFSARHCLVMHESHPLAGRETIDYADLRDVPLAMKGRTYVMYNTNLSRFLTAGVQPCTYLETSDDTLILQLAAQNRAVGVSLDYVVSGRLPEHVVMRPFSDPACARTVYAAHRAGEELTGAAEEFSRALGGFFARRQ